MPGHEALMSDPEEVTECPAEWVERHHPQADLIADHDDWAIMVGDRGEDVGEVAAQHGVDARRVVREREAGPEGESVEQDRRARRHVANRGREIVAGLDCLPLGRPIAPVAPDPPVQLGVAGHGGRDVGDGAARCKRRRALPPEPALATPRAAEDHDEVVAHETGNGSWMAIPARMATNVISTIAP